MFCSNVVVKKRILITDDDPGLQDIFKIILEKAGYSVKVLTNGNEILENNFLLPDLFLLDKQLSGIDGIDVCKYLKSKKRTCKIPVIMVSANPNIAALSEQAGADDYIEKPFQVKDLLTMIEHYI
jgi:DNA-binding response OmpR family regulator